MILPLDPRAPAFAREGFREFGREFSRGAATALAGLLALRLVAGVVAGSAREEVDRSFRPPAPATPARTLARPAAEVPVPDVELRDRIEALQEDLDAADSAALEAAVGGYKAILEELVAWRHGPPMDLSEADAAGVATLARLVPIEAELRARRGDRSGAFQVAAAGLRLAESRLPSPDSPLLAAALSQHSQDRALRALARLRAAGELDASSRDQLRRLLERLDPLGQQASALAAEHRVTLDYLDRFPLGEQLGDRLARWCLRPWLDFEAAAYMCEAARIRARAALWVARVFAGEAPEAPDLRVDPGPHHPLARVMLAWDPSELLVAAALAERQRREALAAL